MRFNNRERKTVVGRRIRRVAIEKVWRTPEETMDWLPGVAAARH
jgi:hypothetical protein